MNGSEAIAQLENLISGSKDAMKRAEFTVANSIALTAIDLAPEDTGMLVESIDIVQSGGESTVEIGAPYAAYVEFGVGPFAAEYVPTLPKEWQDEARRFFVNGKGNTQAHPFFYPAIQQHLPGLEAELEKELEKLTK